MMNNPSKELREYGIIPYFLEQLFYYARRLSLAEIFSDRLAIQKKLDEAKTDKEKEEITKPGSRKKDLYVTAFILLEIVLAVLVWVGWSYADNTARPLAVKVAAIVFGIIAGYRIYDIIQANVNLVIFDGFRRKGHKHYIASALRTILLSIVNYFELMMCFSIVYATVGGCLAQVSSFTDILCFSVLTQLTVSFGTITPEPGWGQLISCIQVVLGYLFGLLILARTIAFLPKASPVIGDSSEGS